MHGNMSDTEAQELRKELAELRAEVARLREAQAQLVEHPDLEGFREWSRAIRDRRVNEWSYDIQMWPGAYKLTRNIVITILTVAFVIMVIDPFGITRVETFYDSGLPPAPMFEEFAKKRSR